MRWAGIFLRFSFLAHLAKAITSRVEAMANRQKLALGAGFFSIFFVNHGISALAIPYYQMTLGMDPFVLGLVMTLPILLSALISPWVGYVIERHQTTIRRRKFFILISGWISAACYATIWMAPASWDGSKVIIYLLVTSLLFFFAAAFLTITVRCLAYEVGIDRQEQTSVMGYTAIFEKIGSALYYWIFPLAQSSFFQTTHQGIRYICWFVAVVLIGVFSSLAGLYAKTPLALKSPEAKVVTLKHVALVEPYQNQFNWLLGLVALQVGVIGLCVSMDFYVLVYYVSAGDIHEGANWKGVLSAAYALFSLLSIPLVVRASNRFGKKLTLKAIYILSAFGGVAKWFIYTPGNEYLLIVDAFLGAWIWTAMSVIIPSMLADLCYLNWQKTGTYRDSTVVARHNWALNLSLVFAMLLSGLALNIIGFDAAAGQDQSPVTITAMRSILSIGSVAFSLLPLWVLSHINLDRE